MNSVDQLRFVQLRKECESGLANTVGHLHQMLGHLRAAKHYNQQHGLQLDLPSEKPIADALSQCARIHQLDKETAR